eukprot:SAG22_NODE_2646_length_2339_cov_6.228571_4_plen_56_part_00
MLDNTLWHGRVFAESTGGNTSTKAVRRLNEQVFADERVDCCMLPTADGITIVCKR